MFQGLGRGLECWANVWVGSRRELSGYWVLGSGGLVSAVLDLHVAWGAGYGVGKWVLGC